MNIITLEEEALHKLIDTVFQKLNTSTNRSEDLWINQEEAMKLLKMNGN